MGDINNIEQEDMVSHGRYKQQRTREHGHDREAESRTHIMVQCFFLTSFIHYE